MKRLGSGGCKMCEGVWQHAGGRRGGAAVGAGRVFRGRGLLCAGGAEKVRLGVLARGYPMVQL